MYLVRLLNYDPRLLYSLKSNRIIMGLDRLKKTPCGFCFVEFYTRSDALDAMKFLNLTKVDERVVRTDVDPGFVADRQYGRGKSGGQVGEQEELESCLYTTSNDHQLYTRAFKE